MLIKDTHCLQDTYDLAHFMQMFQKEYRFMKACCFLSQILFLHFFPKDVMKNSLRFLTNIQKLMFIHFLDPYYLIYQNIEANLEYSIL